MHIRVFTLLMSVIIDGDTEFYIHVKVDTLKICKKLGIYIFSGQKKLLLDKNTTGLHISIMVTDYIRRQ